MISNKKVPNEYNSPKILIIGEAPGRDEETEGKPFVGQSGELLFQALHRVGITRDNVSLLNLSQYRPHENKFEYLEDSQVLRDGVAEIKSYLRQQQSSIRVVILLGERPLNYIGGRYGISKWRGSVIKQDGINFISTYHPAFVLRDRSSYPIFTFDISKAFEVFRSGYNLPESNFSIDPRGLELEEKVQELIASDELAVDIESVKDSSHIICCGFATSANDAVCIVNHSFDGLESSFVNALRRILESPNKKIFHNGLFDVDMLHLNSIDTENFHYDTMIGQHILEPELPKGLDFLTSIYTDRPYYKDMGKSAIPDNEKAWGSKIDKEKLYIYNCLDCVATYEIYKKQERELIEEGLKEFFDYEMEMTEVALHISRSGMLLDSKRVALIKSTLLSRTLKDQELLNNITKCQLNVRSPKQLKEVLFDRLRLPLRKNYNGGVTTDENAIVSLMTFCQTKINGLVTENKKFEWQLKLAALKLILKIRGQRQLISNYIDIPISSDGRVRSSYKVAATETGRWAANTYVDGTGFNGQTMPREVLEIVESEINGFTIQSDQKISA